MISLDEARNRVLAGMAPSGVEIVTLEAALGRVLAQTLTATRDQPPSAVSTMDGYAVADPALADETRLELVGSALAGEPFAGTIGPTQCVRIATGGVLPAGAQRVIMQENVCREGDWITVRDGSGPPFVRSAAADFAAGTALLLSGRLLMAGELGLAAAAGLAQLPVWRRPQVAVLASGDELLEPGRDPVDGRVYDSASYALSALIAQWGGVALRQPLLPDDLDRCVERIAPLLHEVDIVLPLGGASVGDRDFLKPALQALGVELAFDRIALMPGKPSWFGRASSGAAVLGLPGNPSSAFVCAYLLLKPALFALTGRVAADATTLLPATTARPLAANGSREAFLRASACPDANGQVMVTADPRQDSGLQTPLVSANALIRREADAAAAPEGTIVEYLPL